MPVKILHATHPEMIVGLDSRKLRDLYLLEEVFAPDDIRLSHSHVERLVIGGAMPARRPLALEPMPGSGAAAFLDRRELGVINIGGPAQVTVDDTAYTLQPRDGLYVPMGSRSVLFESVDAGNPAKLYLVSAPAHARYRTVRILVSEAKPMRLGSFETANQRTIYQYVHPEICQSAQLLLGLTDLAVGSTWNTMPCHLHERRSEVYFYFDMEPSERVFHFMGQPQETRHIVVANEQAVISPPWSIHTGVGTRRYAFIWAMAGENQDYRDMQGVATTALR